MRLGTTRSDLALHPGSAYLSAARGVRGWPCPWRCGRFGAVHPSGYSWTAGREADTPTIARHVRRRPSCQIPIRPRPDFAVRNFGVCDDLGTNPGDTVKPVESGLTAGNRPGRLVWLPRGMACCWLCCGVWLFFENSTGCLISQCQVCLVPVFGDCFLAAPFLVFCRGLFFDSFCWRV
jgi:hypothetical protein